MNKIINTCYFCGAKTNGKKFKGEKFDTEEPIVCDVCDDCYAEDLELVEYE